MRHMRGGRSYGEGPSTLHKIATALLCASLDLSTYCLWHGPLSLVVLWSDGFDTRSDANVVPRSGTQKSQSEKVGNAGSALSDMRRRRSLWL